MHKTLANFVADINSRGVIKKSRFDVVVKDTTFINLGLQLRCEGVKIPGIQALTQEFKQYGGKPNMKLPSGRAHEDITLTFLLSKSMAERHFFENWIHNVTNFENNNVTYYAEAAKDVDINIYDEAQEVGFAESRLLPPSSAAPGTPSSSNGSIGSNTSRAAGQSIILNKITLLSAIPTRIESIDASWADNDQLLRFSVMLTYEQIVYHKIGSNKNFSYQGLLF